MKKTIIIAGIITLLIVGGYFYFLHYTKSFSPEASAEFEEGDLDIKVTYSRPLKKGRDIFGGLEPYGKIWRTGANEATLFETNQDLSIDGKILKAGEYSLWTIPGEKNWKVIFNSETGQWGVNFNREVNKKTQNDVLTAEVPSMITDKVIEQFTISIEKMDDEFLLILLWDKTVVTLPMKLTSQ